MSEIIAFLVFCFLLWLVTFWIVDKVMRKLQESKSRTNIVTVIFGISIISTLMAYMVTRLSILWPVIRIYLD